MIVISNPISVANEISIIHALFEAGLEIFHVRKPDFSEQEMKVFLSKINSNYNKKLVLHSHHLLAVEFSINRIHFTEKMRKETTKESWNHYKENGFQLSTSTHNMEDFNNITNAFEYAFLGPVFQSISKENYGPFYDVVIEIKKRTNFETRLVALGGISYQNCKQLITIGFDGVAILGAIWHSNLPIKNFKQCQTIDLLY
jgi:thiamine-phosphate pyrophosphorylase